MSQPETKGNEQVREALRKGSEVWIRATVNDPLPRSGPAFPGDDFSQIGVYTASAKVWVKPSELLAAAHGEARVALREAAKNADWQQVVLNGGPPCFHIDPEGIEPRFCLRAKRWAGHDDMHNFVSLAQLLAALADEAPRYKTGDLANALEWAKKVTGRIQSEHCDGESLVQEYRRIERTIVEMFPPQLQAAADEEGARAGVAAKAQVSLKCSCQPIHSVNCPFSDARSSSYRHFYEPVAGAAAKGEGPGMREALEQILSISVWPSKFEDDQAQLRFGQLQRIKVIANRALASEEPPAAPSETPAKGAENVQEEP